MINQSDALVQRSEVLTGRYLYTRSATELPFPQDVIGELQKLNRHNDPHPTFSKFEYRSGDLAWKEVKEGDEISRSIIDATGQSIRCFNFQAQQYADLKVRNFHARRDAFQSGAGSGILGTVLIGSAVYVLCSGGDSGGNDPSDLSRCTCVQPPDLSTLGSDTLEWTGSLQPSCESSPNQVMIEVPMTSSDKDAEFHTDGQNYFQ
ncbi:hypothetical protein I302_104578 [Kwoniella bestiolae CBS 10118]|uniref:Uncharacterized protein n=1 Tax=Kwoniella bestiolae CBS 10118 TaxID=1296100 RepID=A0A1B9GBN3_9TREE|nr:hypothetical protein I302_03284 [Kwoniella bestiolae CBS 10118]OCF28425.1 hypothetical protein I302_03284 [Kwoniella bestiolae CBS 10118]